MKKIILFISAAFIFNAVLAQSPTILGTYLPVVNTEIKQVWNTWPTLSEVPIPTYSTDSNNAAQIWDYSNSFVTQADTFFLRTISPENPNVANLDGNPISHHFPGATHASFVRSPFAVADSLWSFFRVDQTGMYGVGHFALRAPITNSNLAFEDTTIEMLNEEIIIPSRVEYLDHFTDTNKSLMHFELLGYPAKLIQTSYAVYDVRGHGQLITPFASYNDVLLATANIVRFDSVYVDVTSSGNYNPVADSVLSNYNLNPYSDPALIRRHYFLRNNTFASSLLMQLNTDTLLTEVKYAWYTLPSDVGTIEGNVYADTLVGAAGVNGAEVYLFREHGNFTKDDVLATVTTDANGSYIFEDIPYGMYRVAARMMTPQGNYTPEHSYLTYFEDTTSTDTTINPALGVDWTQCDLITTSGPTTVGKNIYMRHDTLAQHQAGAVPSLLSGTLTGIDLNKQGGSDPMPGIDIIIKKDPGSKPIISTQTDINGEFSFANLPDGDYKIWVDMPGVDLTSSYNFNVNKGVYNRCEFDFTSNLDSIDRTGQNTSACLTFVNENDKKINDISIYPNPFENSTIISLNIDQKEKVSIELYDLTGKLVQTILYKNIVSGLSNYEVNNILNSGVYFVKIQIGKETITKKIIKL